MAYAITKVGLTVLTMGLSEELKGTGKFMIIVCHKVQMIYVSATTLSVSAAMNRHFSVSAVACYWYRKSRDDSETISSFYDEKIDHFCGRLLSNRTGAIRQVSH